MPNRRQRIKYEGLDGYRMRERTRRMMDGRNPYGSAGGYVVSGRRDGLMMDDMRAYHEGMYPRELSQMTMQNQPIHHDLYMPKDYAMNDYARREQDMARRESDLARREQDMRGGQGGRRSDYGSGEPYAGVPAFYEQNDMARGYGSRAVQGGQRADYAYGDMARREGRADYGYDGHHMGGGYGMGGYMPIEAMGHFNGYYGMPHSDYAKGNYSDYGETLSEEEMEHWCKKLKSQLDEREKQMFSKEAITKHAKAIGKQMEGFGEKELELTTLMIYTDYKNSIGQNLDLSVRLAFDWLCDKDAAVKGAEKLAIYHDCIVEGED